MRHGVDGSHNTPNLARSTPRQNPRFTALLPAFPSQEDKTPQDLLMPASTDIWSIVTLLLSVVAAIVSFTGVNSGWAGGTAPATPPSWGPIPTPKDVGTVDIRLGW